MSSAAQEAAAGVLEDLMGTDDEAEQDVPSSTAEAVAPAAQETAPEVNLEPELPEDILADLQDDDEEDEEPEEPEEDYVAESDDEYTDPEVAKLRARVKSAEKKAEHERKLRLTSEKKKWAAEAAKFFPLADPSTITADSRRAFRREAQKQHERLKNNPQFKAFLDSERQKVRAEAQAAWGTPTAGPGVQASEVRAQQEGLEQAKRSGRLDKIIYERFKQAGVK
jgi:hypothetical protein